MIAYLDTEFTGLTIRPRLLSVGMVAACAIKQEFYAEVTDSERIAAATAFTRAAVLTQFGKLPGTACTYLELGARLVQFLDTLIDTLPQSDRLVVAHGYYLDWEFIEAAAEDCGTTRWETIQGRLRPINIHHIVGHAAGAMATEAYFSQQGVTGISRHHALCDARALRLAFETVCPPAPAMLHHVSTRTAMQ